MSSEKPTLEKIIEGIIPVVKDTEYVTIVFPLVYTHPKNQLIRIHT